MLYCNMSAHWLLHSQSMTSLDVKCGGELTCVKFVNVLQKFICEILTEMFARNANGERPIWGA